MDGQQGPHHKPVVNSGAHEGRAVRYSYKTPPLVTHIDKSDKTVILVMDERKKST